MPRAKIADALGVHLQVRADRHFEHFPKISLDVRKNNDLQKLVNIATGADERLAAILADSDLSTLGQDKAALAARTSARAKAVAWREKLTATLDSQIKSENAALRLAVTTPEPSDPIDRLRLDLQRQEIRRRFDGLGIDSTIGGIVYGNAPPEVQDAMRSAPPIITKGKHGVPEYSPMVEPSIVERHALEAAQQADPAAVERIGELEYLRETYQTLGDAVVAGAFDGAPDGELKQIQAEEQAAAEG